MPPDNPKGRGLNSFVVSQPPTLIGSANYFRTYWNPCYCLGGRAAMTYFAPVKIFDIFATWWPKGLRQANAKWTSNVRSQSKPYCKTHFECFGRHTSSTLLTPSSMNACDVLRMKPALSFQLNWNLTAVCKYSEKYCLFTAIFYKCKAIAERDPRQNDFITHSCLRRMITGILISFCLNHKQINSYAVEVVF